MRKHDKRGPAPLFALAGAGGGDGKSKRAVGGGSFALG